MRLTDQDACVACADLAHSHPLAGAKQLTAPPHRHVGTVLPGRNFRLRWLKLVELPFSRTQHLHNPYNEDQPVQVWPRTSLALGSALVAWLTEPRPPTPFHRAQMGRDMQEIEPTVGAQMVGLIYKEAESDLQPLVDEGGGVGAADASLRRQCDYQSWFRLSVQCHCVTSLLLLKSAPSVSRSGTRACGGETPGRPPGPGGRAGVGLAGTRRVLQRVGQDHRLDGQVDHRICVVGQHTTDTQWDILKTRGMARCHPK